MYKSKVSLFVWCFLSFGHFANAQTASISGKVVERSTKEPLPFASILLYKLNDSIAAASMITDDEGKFAFSAVPFDTYFIAVNFLGFVTKETRTIVHDKNTAIGPIELVPSNILLDGVTVVGEKAMFQNKIDRKVYQVGKDVMSETGSAGDILQNIPSIMIDIDGGISLRGTSNITIFVNGKPSAIFRRNVTGALEQLPATSIERIEIITNPSAKFRPDGVGGIINIVLKKKKKSGLNGLLSANVGTEKRFNSNAGLNYGVNDFNVFSNYGFRHSAGITLYTDERLFKDPINEESKNLYRETGQSDRNKNSHNFFGGMSYELNDFNAIELSANYNLEKSLREGIADIVIFDDQSQLSEAFTNFKTKDEIDKELEVDFAFEHVFKNNEDHTLNFELAYANYYEREELDFRQIYTLPIAETKLDQLFIEKGGHQTDISVDYTLPVEEDKAFEFGYAGEFIHENIKYGNNVNASRFLFDRAIHGFYATYGQSIENFRFLAGLRAEQTFLTTEVLVPTISKTPNNDFKLFPTLHLSYELDDTQEIGLSYSKRLNRPDPDELNPNPEFDDPRNAEAGNPKIKPEQIHSLELAYQVTGKKISFAPTLYYRYIYDAFTSIQSTIGDSIVLSTNDNLATEQELGFELVLSKSISDKWNVNLSGNAFYNTIDATNLGLSANKSVLSGRMKGFLVYDLTKSTRIQLNAFYRFARITPQGKRDPFFYLNGGLKQSLFGKRASISLTVSDIFHTYKVTQVIESAQLHQKTTRQRKRAVIYLGFNWLFNNYNKKIQGEFESEGL